MLCGRAIHSRRPLIFPKVGKVWILADVWSGARSQPMVIQGQGFRIAMLFLQTTRTGSVGKVRGISPIYSQILRDLESKTTDGKLRSKFTVFARVFELRLRLPPFSHSNQFRLCATVSALESPGAPLCDPQGQVSSFPLVRSGSASVSSPDAPLSLLFQWSSMQS